jgi:broad specificity phosphatase PhoE
LLNIYITRHGETRWNKENRLQGWKNSDLTKGGVRNAILLGERLAQTEFNKIYSSSSERALKTAKLIRSERPIPVIVVDDLKEISFGDWEGKTQEEIEENFEKEYADFWYNPHQYNHLPHKAEGLSDFKQRVKRAMKEIVETNTNGNLLIVTHGVVIKAIMSFFWNIPTKQLWEPPIIHGASLTLVKWDGQEFQKELIGDTTHLELQL